MNLLHVSWKNLWNKSLSTILSLILIAFGVGLLSVLVLFQNQFSEQFEKNQAGIGMVVGAKGSPLQLILNSMFHIDAPTGNIKIKDAAFLFNKKNPYIENSVPLSVGDSYKSFRIIGTDHSILDLYSNELSEGKLWSDKMEVTVGFQVAQELNLALGDEFYSSHGFNEGDLEHDEGEKFKIVGILAAHGSVIDKLILANTEAIWSVHDSHGHSDESIDHEHEGHDHGSGDHDHNHENVSVVDSLRARGPKEKSFLDYPEKEITSVLIQFKEDKKRAIPVINMPRGITENTPLMATAPAYELNKLMANVGSGIKGLKYLAMLIAIISALSIFISLYNNLRDRKHELAMMRVVGAKPVQLFKLILFEAIIIGIIGSIIGLILSHLAMMFISGMLNNQFHYGLDSWKLYPAEFIILGATIFISVIAGLFPAWKAYRTDIIKNLS